jgi:hypothetical protein
MLTNQEINRLNKFLGNKTFNYQGLMIFNTRTMVDLDYKFEIIGYKQMISVGQYYDYINISLTIFNFRDKLSQLIFSSNDTKEQEFWKSFFDNNLFFFKQQILGDIRNILINFDPNIKIHIGKINIELPEKENIQEQKMTRYAIRNVVKDIVKILKTEEEGDYTLPDNDYGGGYEFDRFPVEFSVDLYVSHDDSFDGYKLNAEYSPEDDTIEISIVYNPSDLKTSLYEIIGELNEVLAHELEHSLQEYRGEFDDDDDDEETDPLKYYLQAHEIPAQVAGFKRLSRLRKVPFETVVRNWFKTHGEIHQLNDKEQKIVINKLLKYKKP